MGKAMGRLIAAGALCMALGGGLGLSGLSAAHSQDKPAPDPGAKQTVLGPGLFVFQTRTREATCKDSEQNGYVSSYFAAIDGVPEALSMTMDLINTSYFKSWTLKVVDNVQVIGDSRIGTAADAPDIHFEVKLDKDRFKGTGYRTYNGTFEGKKTRCRVNFDALLRRLY